MPYSSDTPPKPQLGKYVDLRYDTPFKLVFSHADVLRLFLNTFLELEGDQQITEITYRDKEKPGPTAADRISLFDLYCTAQDGRHFIIEMQRKEQRTFFERALYYVAVHIQEQAPLAGNRNAAGDKGTWNFELDPVVFVGLLNFTLFPQTEDPVSHFCFYNMKKKQVMSDHLILLFLELPKFRKTQLADCETVQERFLFYLRYLHTLDIDPEDEPDPVLQNMLRYALVANLTPKQMNAVLAELNQQWVRNAELTTAEERGIEIGKERGIEIGEERGEKRGEQKGEETSLQITKALMAGESPEAIAASLQVPLAKVTRIKETLGL